MEACAQIRERLSEIKGLGHPNQYGLFLMDEDPKKGVWLEPGRTLEHYLLRDNVSVNFSLDVSIIRIMNFSSLRRLILNRFKQFVPSMEKFSHFILT